MRRMGGPSTRRSWRGSPPHPSRGAPRSGRAAVPESRVWPPTRSECTGDARSVSCGARRLRSARGRRGAGRGAGAPRAAVPLHASSAARPTRLRVDAEGQVCVALRHQWSDGTTHLRFDPITFLERLAVLIPRPRINTVIVREHR